MIKHKLTIAVLFFSLNLIAQENLLYEKNLPAYNSYFSEEFGIDFNIPEGFTSMEKYFVMWKVRKNNDKHTGSMYGPLFLSRDKNCLIMYPSFPTYVSKDKMEINNDMKLPLNPRSQIKVEIETALGMYYYHAHPLNSNAIKFDFNEYVTVLSGKKVREMFNADSLYIYDIPGAESVFFIDESLEKLRKRKYPKCTGFVVVKNARAVLDFKFFFTEEGEKNKEEYCKKLGKYVWFDENFEHE
ncbi:hypothetical protein MASR2M47_31000 [Draconibacterium sp.]